METIFTKKTSTILLPVLSEIWWDYFCWKKEEWNLWLTRSASIEASSHGNMSIPRDNKDSEEARTDSWAQFVRNNSVSVAVTSEYLMIRKIIRCESQIMLVYLLKAGFNWGKKKHFFAALCYYSLHVFKGILEPFVGRSRFRPKPLVTLLCAISCAAH